MSGLDVTGWSALLAEMTGGKRIAGAVYLHVSALPALARELVQRADLHQPASQLALHIQQRIAAQVARI